jgi:hypothetical protein
MISLQCDADGCDHRENIPDYSAEYIGKPCPKCGASLLTQEDYDDFHRHLKPAIDLLLAAGLAKMNDGVKHPGTLVLGISTHGGVVSAKTKLKDDGA